MMALLICFQACSGDETSAASLPRTTFPGVGVTLMLPAELKPGPLGAYAADERRETTFNFAVTRDPGGREAREFAWPGEPEKFQSAHLEGKLYELPRARNPEKVDGWMLQVARGDLLLTAFATYGGPDPSHSRQIHAILETLEWDEKDFDPERAFGAHIDVPGLTLVRSVAGGLSYSLTGEKGSGETTLIVMAMNIAPGSAAAIVPARCNSGFSRAFANQDRVGPEIVEHEGFIACDSWDRATNGRKSYLSVLRTPNGAVLNVLGSGGDPLQFRAAMFGMQILRPSVAARSPAH